MARKSKREKMMTTCWGGGGVSREKTQVQKDYGFLAGKGKPLTGIVKGKPVGKGLGGKGEEGDNRWNKNLVNIRRG